MTTNTQTPENQDSLYEKKDYRARVVLLFGAGIIFLCLIAAGAVWAFFQVYRTLVPSAPQVSAVENLQQEPPLPRLQSNEEQGLEALRAREDSVLYTYGWVDKQKGIARIPIGRAMELLAKKGLPNRPPSAENNPSAVTGSEGFEDVEPAPIPGVPTVSGVPGGPITGKGTQAVGPGSTLQNVGKPAKAQEAHQQ